MVQTNPGSSIIVVCDAGPVIHLDELDQLPLLNDFSEVLIPDTVWNEVQKHRPQAIELCRQWAQKVTPVQPLSAKLQATIQLFSLHAGEIQALQIIEEHPTDLFLTDDSAARLAAGTVNVKVHGTLGILLRAIRRQQLTRQQVVSLLKAIPDKTSLHLRPSLLKQIISEVEDSS
ncbi:MAG: hypothetical protein R3F02_06720 [Thiolinea sp.]